MNRWIAWPRRCLELALVLALAAMVVLVFGNVVLRYAFNSGITVSEELSRWLFIWSTFLGAVLALHDRAHLGVDVVVGRLPPAGRRACLITGHLLMLGTLGLLLQGSLQQARINWDVSAPATGASMAWVYSAGVVFAVLAGAVLTIDLLRLLAGRLTDDELVMVRESEESEQLERLLATAPSSKRETS